MVRDGKLIGKGKLTAILNPVLSELGGANYFATRLQVALQYTTRAGKTGNLLGSMKEDTTAEMEARTELAKWQPVRRHMRDFAKGGGIGFQRQRNASARPRLQPRPVSIRPHKPP